MNCLSGIYFEQIRTVGEGSTPIEGNFYEMIFLEVGGPDFFLYDKIKLGASPKAVSVVQQFNHKNITFIGLDEMSEPEKFYAEFENRLKDKSL